MSKRRRRRKKRREGGEEPALISLVIFFMVMRSLALVLCILFLLRYPFPPTHPPQPLVGVSEDQNDAVPPQEKLADVPLLVLLWGRVGGWVGEWVAETS